MKSDPSPFFATFDTIVLVACCLALAGLIWSFRNSIPKEWQRWTAALLPFVMLGLLTAGAAIDGSRGSKLTAEISGFVVPSDAVPSDGLEVLVFRVGDRSEAADLVVRPFLQDFLNQGFAADDPRHYVDIFASRSADGTLAARMELTQYPGDPAQDIPGMRTTIGGTVEELTEGDALRSQVRLAPGQSARPAIFRDDSSTSGRQYQARRSFEVRNRAREGEREASIVIDLDQPLRADAGTCADPRNVLIPAARDGAPPPGYLMPRSLEFAALGTGGHARAILGTQALGPIADREGLCQAGQIEWPAPGSSDASRLQMDFTYLAVPWLPVWLLFASCLASVLIGKGTSRAESILMPVLLFLLALRSLVAVASAFYDTSIPPHVFFNDAACATIALPPLLAALIRPVGDTGRTEWLGWLALSAALVGITLLWTGGMAPSPDLVAVLILTATLLMVRAIWPDRSPVQRIYERMPESFQLAGTQWHALLAKLKLEKATDYTAKQMTRIPAQRLLRAAFVLLVCLFAVRFLLAVPFGFKERVGAIPLSLPFLFTLILAATLGTIGVRSLQRDRLKGACWLMAGLSLAFLVFMPGMVSDTGFVLVHLPPIAGVIAWHLARSASGDRSRVAAAGIAFAPLAALLALMGVLAWQDHARLSVLEDPNTPVADRIQASLGADPNSLRLIQLVSPETVESVGTLAAYRQMEQSAMLHSLTDDVFGEGWLAPAELLSIRKEQAWDYVAAVHIMHPFGRIGAVAILILLGAMAGALVTGTRTRILSKSPEEVAGFRIAGQMATWTLFFSATYMVLGNLLLVPFTGRNIYLLANLSSGDMLEGLMLVALSTLALFGNDE
ncbi:hypothetical protein [Qipengyuania sp. JC766]|uniref:hypothetical protein n=1 Tax=Qipengyuania sp. JC766 TaxID=3232139 RepID=UPI00345863FD